MSLLLSFGQSWFGAGDGVGGNRPVPFSSSRTGSPVSQCVGNCTCGWSVELCPVFLGGSIGHPDSASRLEAEARLGSDAGRSSSRRAQ